MRSHPHHFLHNALTTAALIIGVAALVYAMSAHGKPESVALQGFNGQDLGVAHYEIQPKGTTLDISLKAMSPGWYEVKIHDAGACTGQDNFSDAGMPVSTVTMKRNDELITANDEKQAGTGTGLLADETGLGEAQFFADSATHNRLNDQNGSAIIVHSLRPEDTEGGKDAMVACGVIAPPQP